VGVSSVIKGAEGNPVDVESTNGYHGLVTLTDNLYSYDTKAVPALNDDYGTAMNQSVTFGGTPEGVHNGTDTSSWTGSNISGNKVTFNSGDRANTGTKSVKVDKPALNNTWQFSKGSDLTVSGYTAITFAVNVDKDWNGNDSVSLYGYDTGLAAQVGDKVYIENYFNETVFDVWHTVTIPLADMGLTGAETLDALRMTLEAKTGKQPKFYLDDIQFEKTGTPAVFTIEAGENDTFYLDRLQFLYADAYDMRLADSSVPNLSYDSILGVSGLTSGFQLQYIKDGDVAFSNSVTGIGDHLRLGTRVVEAMSDGTNSMLILETHFEGKPIILEDRTRDKITFTINDDLSGLSLFNVTGFGRVRK